jgi:hypothetical protein
MWRWDQGHVPYFNFDAIKLLAKATVQTDVVSADQQLMYNLTGLGFSAPDTHGPWRNYGRVFKLCLLTDAYGTPTTLARKLLIPGLVEGDQYFHFLARAFAIPSPAFKNYDHTRTPRWPLLVALKMLLAHTANSLKGVLSIDDLVSAFQQTNASGEEDFVFFSNLGGTNQTFGIPVKSASYRQAKESLAVLSQLSYLTLRRTIFAVSLSPAVARDLFLALSPIGGARHANPSDELTRLANAFDGATESFFSMPEIDNDLTMVFPEGARKFRTHFYLERNRNIRKLFFEAQPRLTCDVCHLNTKVAYNVEGMLDLHHLLPLSSGSRVNINGTSLRDLVPVCPTCHRAVHKFYSTWLREKLQQDFSGIEEARGVYNTAKSSFRIGNRNA